MTNGLKSLLESVLTPKYQELFQIGLELPLLDYWKKLNNCSQLHFVAVKVGQVKHVQNIPIHVIVPKVKTHLKSLPTEQFEGIVPGMVLYFSLRFQNKS